MPLFDTGIQGIIGFFAAGGTEDTILKLLEGTDAGAMKGTISSAVRLLGFGPEADTIATVIVGILTVLMLVGYGAKGVAAKNVIAEGTGAAVPSKEAANSADTKKNA